MTRWFLVWVILVQEPSTNNITERHGQLEMADGELCHINMAEREQRLEKHLGQSLSNYYDYDPHYNTKATGMLVGYEISCFSENEQIPEGEPLVIY